MLNSRLFTPLACLAMCCSLDAATVPSFDKDVQPILQAKCVMCHGAGAVSGGYAPDLRASPLFASKTALKAVVQQGAKMPLGMPRFTDLTDDDVDAIETFVRHRAAEDAAAAAKQAAKN